MRATVSQDLLEPRLVHFAFHWNSEFREAIRFGMLNYNLLTLLDILWLPITLCQARGLPSSLLVMPRSRQTSKIQIKPYI
jgi:hypothetical protein